MTTPKSNKISPKSDIIDQQMSSAVHIEQLNMTDKLQFDPNCHFYYSPACCGLVHYRYAAILAAALQVVLLVFVTIFCMGIGHNHDSTGSGNGRVTTGIWMIMILALLVVAAILTAALMVYGILTEQASLLWPQMIFLLTFAILSLLVAIFSIFSMSAGYEITNLLFGTFVNIGKIEIVLGPIWPFCLSVVFFFCAATAIWFYVAIRGCYDYLLDKQYFSENPSCPFRVPNDKDGDM